MHSIKSILQNLFDETIDIRIRLLKFILFCVCIATFVCGIPMYLVWADGWWWNMVLCVLAVICQIINIGFKKTELAALMLAIMTDCIMVPVMYFSQGGAVSGMPVWMFFCSIVTFIMMNGVVRYVLTVLSITINCLCFAAEYYYPEWVTYVPDRAFFYSDIIISFVAALIVCSVILGITLRAYKHRGEALSYALNYDALTGVENRYSFERTIHELNELPSLPDNLILVSADVNGLKVVNDTLGHAAGDELLVGAAKEFSRTFNRYGKVFRTGGDEFQAILFSDRPISEIQTEFETNMKAWKGDVVRDMHIAVGYACEKDCDVTDCLALSKIADKRMYAEKAAYYTSNGMNRRMS